MRADKQANRQTFDRHTKALIAILCPPNGGGGMVLYGIVGFNVPLDMIVFQVMGQFHRLRTLKGKEKDVIKIFFYM